MQNWRGWRRQSHSLCGQGQRRPLWGTVQHHGGCQQPLVHIFNCFFLVYFFFKEVNLYVSQVSSDSLLYDRENDQGPLKQFLSVVILLGWASMTPRIVEFTINLQNKFVWQGKSLGFLKHGACNHSFIRYLNNLVSLARKSYGTLHNYFNTLDI